MPGISVSKICVPFGGGGINWSSYWATRKPSDLIVTDMRDTEIDFAWTDNSAGVASFIVYKSTDGVTYVQDGTTVAGDTTYTAIGMTAGVLYYFYVVGVKDMVESPATNIYDTRFKITIDTTKAGSAADTFVLPTDDASVYDYYVDWGDGGSEEHIEVNTSQTHVYAAPGIYQVKIRGTFPRIRFGNTGDKAKLITINNWGNIKWSTMTNAFYGCSAMNGAYDDVPNMTAALFNCERMFSNCVLFNYKVPFNTAEVTRIFGMFYGDLAFNQSVSSFNTAKAINMTYMFYGCSSFKQSLATFSHAASTDIKNMLFGCDINEPGTTTNYDATLVAWAAQNPPNSLSFHGGTSKYGEGLVDNGTTDGAAANKLIQSGQNFLTTVTIGDVVYNTTDGTYAFVTAIDSDTQLSISADIMASGEVYRIQHSDAAKARAKLILTDLWTITDGGYA